MKAKVEFIVQADRPHEWAEMYGGEQEAREAFMEFVRGVIEDRFGGGCSAKVTKWTEMGQ